MPIRIIIIVSFNDGTKSPSGIEGNQSKSVGVSPHHHPMIRRRLLLKLLTRHKNVIPPRKMRKRKEVEKE
jgi:hypothetical protein